MMGEEQGRKNQPGKEPILPIDTERASGFGNDKKVVNEQLRADLLALEEDIPGSSRQKDRELLDPDEEMEVIERKLDTRYSLLDSLHLDEIERRAGLKKEILELEMDLRFFKKKKRGQRTV